MQQSSIAPMALRQRNVGKLDQWDWLYQSNDAGDHSCGRKVRRMFHKFDRHLGRCDIAAQLEQMRVDAELDLAELQAINDALFGDMALRYEASMDEIVPWERLTGTEPDYDDGSYETSYDDVEDAWYVWRESRYGQSFLGWL